jgi:S1-C subfamily serine protease
MTAGIVSALGRTLPAGEGDGNGPIYTIPDIIQTDAPINPGNSGGVLVDERGEVIGVTAAIESPVGTNAGIGFVIPSALVQKVIPALISQGHYDHPYLGITGTTLTPDLAKAMNLKTDQRGALIEDVTPAGPADQAGLRGSDRQVTIDGQDVRVGGDVITAIDGKPVKSMDDLITYLTNETEVGQKVSLSFLRSGEASTAEIVLEARPESSTATTNSTEMVIRSAWLGIEGVALTPDIAQAMDLKASQRGFLVQQVVAGSPADQAGLRGSFKPMVVQGQQILVGGDVITEMDGQSITSLEELAIFLQQAHSGQEIILTILRDGKQSNVRVTLGAQDQ